MTIDEEDLQGIIGSLEGASFVSLTNKLAGVSLENRKVLARLAPHAAVGGQKPIAQNSKTGDVAVLVSLKLVIYRKRLPWRFMDTL